MRRVISAEMLDEDRGTPCEVRESLNDLWRINRWLGGVSSNLQLFQAFFARTGAHPVRVLDVGAGDSRLAGHLQAELRRLGLPAEFTVLDRRLGHLRNGQRPPAVPSVAADALALPFANDTFNVVMCNLLFHHFSGEAAIELLRRLAATASEAVLVSDLERHWLPYFFIQRAGWFTRSPITWHDAPASVRQSYTGDELAALASEAGFTDFEVHRFVPFRLGLTLWKMSPRGASSE